MRDRARIAKAGKRRAGMESRVTAALDVFVAVARGPLARGGSQTGHPATDHGNFGGRFTLFDGGTGNNASAA